MRIFARTVTCSWTNAMVIRFARFAAMIRAKRRDSDVSAINGRETHTPPCRYASSHFQTERILSWPRFKSRSPVPVIIGAGAQAVPSHHQIRLPIARQR